MRHQRHQDGYEAHNGALDLFGYERPDRDGYVWFEDGNVATAGSSSQGCDPSEWDVSFHTNGEPGDPQWIGGRLTNADTAMLRVRLNDGQITEHTISSPGYIVPAGIVGGPELASISILGPDGEELFHYDMPSPETGVPPPPSPGC